MPQTENETDPFAETIACEACSGRIDVDAGHVTEEGGYLCDGCQAEALDAEIRRVQNRLKTLIQARAELHTPVDNG